MVKFAYVFFGKDFEVSFLSNGTRNVNFVLYGIPNSWTSVTDLDRNMITSLPIM